MAGAIRQACKWIFLPLNLALEGWKSGTLEYWV
jgi:hypothetical protein